jgi:hypothetical protein
MQAYKIKGKVDTTGNLVISEPVRMPAGDVEVIVLQVVETVPNTTVPVNKPQLPKPKRKVKCSIPILKEWLENTEPTPPDFNPDQAKWEYLKEKHNL